MYLTIGVISLRKVETYLKSTSDLFLLLNRPPRGVGGLILKLVEILNIFDEISGNKQNKGIFGIFLVELTEINNSNLKGNVIQRSRNSDFFRLRRATILYSRISRLNSFSQQQNLVRFKLP